MTMQHHQSGTALTRLGKLAIALALMCLLLPLLPVMPGRAAAGDVRYTVTIDAVYLRDQPSLLAPETVRVYKGEFYSIVSRTDDNLWLLLDTYAPDQAGTWILADLGVVVEGKLDDVPVTTDIPRAPLAYHPAVYPKWIPTITPAMRQVYRQSVAYAKDLHMFTVVGDCNSLPPVYLQRVANGEFDARNWSSLRWVANRFTPSFTRISLAVNGGFNAEAMMDPDWANHALCDKNAGPFACEVWVSRASVVFIEVGTGDQYTWKDFEKNYRPLIEQAQSKGVLPVLVTKADDLEARNGAPSGYINDIIRRLAGEYNVPLLDFWLASRQLPNNGLLDEGGLNFHLSYAGRDLHLVATLQTLDAIAR
jgi:GDSL-like Lipase/Acylhydrolase family